MAGWDAVRYVWDVKRPSAGPLAALPAATPSQLSLACLPTRAALYGRAADIPFRMGGDDELAALATFYHLPWVSSRSLLWETVYGVGPPNFTAEAPWPNFNGDR